MGAVVHLLTFAQTSHRGRARVNVLFTSAEVAPFAKAGGLGDVVGSLPKQLRALGVDARVLMPLYGTIDRARFNIEYAFAFKQSLRVGEADVYIHKTIYDGVPVYFLESFPFFKEGRYVYSDFEWDMPRFVFFSQAVMGTAWALREGKDGSSFFPDVYHNNDWHTALQSFLLAESRRYPDWSRAGSILTIHNMAYQGEYASKALYEAGIPPRTQPDLVYQDKGDNLLAIGVAYSDLITTVSPRYATEIQYPRFGEGLQGLISVRSQDTIGILNGIDMERVDPAIDPLIAVHYDQDSFREGKQQNKLALQRELGLREDPDVPMIGMITRLVGQKGVDLAIPALRQLMAERDCQVVLLGTGEQSLEWEMYRLGYDFGFKARALVKFDLALSQRIYAASDLFLMPSRYEPCGTSQMFSMRYGSLPIVRETGGLADTVENYDNGDAERGTGFVFLWEEPDAVYQTMKWALDTYRYRPDAFRRMQHRAMTHDFGWEKSAREYIRCYETAIARHR